jgi:beta-glucoside PTS system EIICBA component
VLSLGLSFTLTYLMVAKNKGTEQSVPLVNQTR